MFSTKMETLERALLLLILEIIFYINMGHSQLDYNFYQTDYHVTPERADLIRFNKEYVKQYSVTTFKYNRTTTAVNSTMHLKIDAGFDLELVTQFYKFTSNEYRTFPLRVQLNFCKAVTTNVGGVRAGFLKCGNFSNCPLLKNKIYHLCFFTMDESKLPPYIPNGRYMAEIQGMYFSAEMFLMRAYAEISRPISWQ